MQKFSTIWHATSRAILEDGLNKTLEHELIIFWKFREINLLMLQFHEIFFTYLFNQEDLEVMSNS